MTVCFLPVSMYKVKFKVAAGRPYSQFERLVLKAISTKTNELDDLVKLFCVHRRMVVESLVTLMQAGWVSIESQTNQFVLTPSGREAQKQEQSLPPLLRTEDRWQIVVTERVAGQIARVDQVKTTTRKSLAKVWHLGAKIPKSDISNAVDPGMVRPMLSRRSGERIRWVGPITSASDNNAFIVVGVDTDSGKIIGIPKPWEALLSAELLERARRHEGQVAMEAEFAKDEGLSELIDAGPPEKIQENDSYHINLEAEDVAIGWPDHRKMFERFVVGSESFIAIASSTLQIDVVSAFQTLLQEALAKGKSIFICWGRALGLNDVAAHKDALKLLEKLQWDSRQGSVPGRLIVGSSEGQFFGNVIIGDVDGLIEGAVGSHSWLGQQEAQQAISVQVRHPGLVARLCDVVGDYHASDGRLKKAGGLTRLRNAALDLAALAEGSGPGLSTDTDASLVFDRHHAGEIYRMISSARDRVLISCDEFEGSTATDSLGVIQAAIQGDRDLHILLRDQSRLTAIEKIRKLLDETALLRVAVEGPTDAPDGCVIADSSSVLISSYPVLGGVRSSQRSFGSEIGLKLIGNNVATLLLDRMGQPSS